MQIACYLQLLVRYVWKANDVSVPCTLSPLPPLNVCIHGASGDSLLSSSLKLASSLNSSHSITFIGNEMDTKQAILEGLPVRSLGSFDSLSTMSEIYDATFPKLFNLVQDIQPDVVICQGNSPACRDVSKKLNKTLVTLVESLDDIVTSGLVHLPYITNSNKYGPITTESLSLGQRFQDAIIVPIKQYINEFSQVNQLNKLRKSFNVPPSYKLRDYSDSLVLTTSFTGLEPAVSLPPYVHLVGPILHEEIPNNPLIIKETLSFLDSHLRTVFISQELSSSTIEQLLLGILITLEEETVDGIIWEIGHSGGKIIPSTILYQNQLQNTHNLLINSKLRMVSSAPHTTILNHPHTLLLVGNPQLSKSQLALQSQTPILFLPLNENNKRLARKCLDFGVARILPNINALPRLIYAMLHDKSIQLRSQQMRLLATSHYDHINKLITTHGHISKSNPQRALHYLNPIQPNILISYLSDVYMIAFFISLFFLAILVDIFIKYFKALQYGRPIPRPTNTCTPLPPIRNTC